jgi:release factor glutamine methyltransferase
MFVLGCDRAHFFAHPERELTGEEFSRYEELISQRASGIPAQYITGHQEFWGLDFIVTPAVLIPRPETEHLIETVLPPMQGLDRPRMVDVGTGSGCIAVVLAKELPSAEIYAVDISASALEIARANAARNQVEGRIDFRQGDLLAGFEPASLDLVLSNPPYVGEAEEDQVQLEVRRFEPRNAVFAGNTGLEIIERLAAQAEGALKSGGWLAMEISGTIADGVKRILKEWDGVQISNDLQGIPRVVSARRR